MMILNMFPLFSENKRYLKIVSMSPIKMLNRIIWTEHKRNAITWCYEVYNVYIAVLIIYCQTSIARTALRPWKFVLEMGSSSHCGYRVVYFLTNYSHFYDLYK